MPDHSDVEDPRRRHGGVPPRPWRVNIDVNSRDPNDRECWGIVDANGNAVVETDCGYYPPDIETAEFIVNCVNAVQMLRDSEALASNPGKFLNERKEP